MEWILIENGQSVSTNLQNYYNTTTLLKNRFSFASSGTGTNQASVFTSNLHTITIGFDYYYGGKPNLLDSIANLEFGNRNNNNYFAELAGINNEIYAFKDINNHYLVNVYAPFGEGHEIWIHSGVAADGTEVCKINTDIANNVADTLTLTTAFNTLNNSYGNDYILQPLCVLNEKTPFYIVCGNAQLEVFSNIIVNNKKFMIVGKGVCVEVE